MDTINSTRKKKDFFPLRKPSVTLLPSVEFDEARRKIAPTPIGPLVGRYINRTTKTQNKKKESSDSLLRVIEKKSASTEN